MPGGEQPSYGGRVSLVAWVVFLAVALPVLGILGWLLLESSFMRVPPGCLGLVTKRGRATDTALAPGPHWVPSFRRLDVVAYPSLELAWVTHTGPSPEPASGLERHGEALRVVLGDRAVATVAGTTRFRLDPDHLHAVHDRFGPEGIWAAVRDRTHHVLTGTLGDPGVGVEQLFGHERAALEERLTAALGAALADDGFRLVLFTLGPVDLGRTGDVIQATVRARAEVAREEAEAAVRLAQVRHDAAVRALLADEGAADSTLRYREIDVLREFVACGAPSPLNMPAHLLGAGGAGRAPGAVMSEVAGAGSTAVAGRGTPGDGTPPDTPGAAGRSTS